MVAILFSAVRASGQAQQADVRNSTCVTCHLALGDDMAKPIELVRNDVHGKRAVSCHSCHGGDPQQMDPGLSMDPAKGFVGRPTPAQTSAFCAKCHSNSEFMKPFNPSLRVDQHTEWASSVHAEALLKNQDQSAPVCSDCHGSHGVVAAKSASVTGICRTCHIRQAQIFDMGAHKAAFDALGIAECVACHGNHRVNRPVDAMTGVGPESLCRGCHDQGEPGYTTAETMHRQLLSLDQAIRSSALTLDRASRAGMEVAGARFDLIAAREKLIDARVVVHAFSVEDLNKVISPGMAFAGKAEQAGQSALAELQYRRKGLAVSLLVIAVAVFSVYLKVREIERPASQRSSDHLEEQ
jgi:predicted CXXCH cytochrome family protein